MSKKGHALFRHERISSRVIRLVDASDTCMYLLQGTDRAVLIDTGYGLGDLPRYIRELTSLPVTVLITHAHRDHAMGSSGFKAYMNPKELQGYRFDCTDARRRQGMEAAQKKSCNGLYQYADPEDWRPVLPAEEFHPLTDGDHLDLGGLTVETFEVNGHSPGSLVFLIPEERLLMVGDSCGWQTRIFCPVYSHMEDLTRMHEKTKGRYDRVINSHEGGELPENIVSGVIAVCEDVLAGRDDHLPFEHADLAVFAGRDMRWAKRMVIQKGGLRRADGGIGGLVYDRQMMR